MRANTNLRIALRVQDDGDSLDVIGIADAARLSRRTPGRAYLRLGSGDVTEFQAALVSGGGDSTGAARRSVARPFTLFAADRRADDDAVPAPHGPSDLERLATACRIAARQVGCRPPRVPWPAPLPATVDAVDLWATAGHEPWTVPLGLADEPDEQRQGPWRWRAIDGGLLVYGHAPADTARVLTTLAFGLANDHAVDAVHLYVVDAGSGGALAAVADLPHCGSLVHAADTAGVARLLDTLSAIVDERRALVRERRITTVESGDDLPLVVLLVDNIGAVLDALDADDERDAPTRLAALVRDGASLGIVTAMTASHERALPSRLAASVSQRVTLRMADPTSYLALGLALRTVPSLAGLRGVTIGAATDVQFAELADPAAMARAIAAQAASTQRPSRPPRRVRKLGAVVRLDDVGGDAGRLDDHAWSLTIAATASLRPVRLELRAGIDALVAGPPGSGRSTALVAIARAALTATAGDVHLVSVTPRTSLLTDVVGARWQVDHADALDAAVAAAGDAPTLVLVDDAEHVPAALGQALGRLAERPRDRTRVVVAGRADVLRAPGAWTAPLRHGRTGIALDPAPGDGDVFRTTFPLRSPVRAGAGRGFVVSIGSATAAQILRST